MAPIKIIITLIDPIAQFGPIILTIYTLATMSRLLNRTPHTFPKEARRLALLLLLAALALPLLALSGSNCEAFRSPPELETIQSVVTYTLLMQCGTILAHLLMDSNASLTNSLAIGVIIFPMYFMFIHGCGLAELKYLSNAVPRTAVDLLYELQMLVVRYVVFSIFYARKLADWVYYHDSCRVFAKRLNGNVDGAAAVLQESFLGFNVNYFVMDGNNVCTLGYEVVRFVPKANQ